MHSIEAIANIQTDLLKAITLHQKVRANVAIQAAEKTAAVASGVGEEGELEKVGLSGEEEEVEVGEVIGEVSAKKEKKKKKKGKKKDIVTKSF